ncbi:MAG: hypothetical protein LH472_04695 [Pyrinomonadaceae bacterium]|nr:hypothetical protein [Pyrinomonadaceae bacterium]
MKPKTLQTFFVVGGIFVLPFVPFLYWQGRRVRRKIGRLPDAGGAVVGKFGEFAETVNLLAIG